MFDAISKFWSTCFVLFDTVERFGNAANELAQIAEAEAKILREKSSHKLANEVLLLDAGHAELKASIKAA